jgi:hypothetical protein
MNKKVYVRGNSVFIEDEITGAKEYIGFRFFSFEIVGTTIQLVDSSKVDEVVSLDASNFLDEAGAPVGTVDVIENYLADFTENLPVVVTPESEVQIVDELGDSVPQNPNVSAQPTTKGLVLMGEDKDGILRRIRTETDGRLISSASVVNPPNTTPIGDTVVSDVSGTIDSDTIIPNGETLVIQSLSGGGEGETQGSKVELWQFTDGSKLTGTLLGILYVNGSNGSQAVNRGFIGDGNAIITLRRERLSGGAIEVFGVWQGYY